MKKLILSNFLIVLFVLIGTVNVVQAQYTVTYDANGATEGSVPSSQTKENDVPLTLESNTGSLVRDGHFFAGWNTQADGFGTDYAEGATYTANADVTLYAKWFTSGASRWIGADGLGGDGNWNTAAHWSTGVVPNTTSTDVIIKSGATITITANVGIRKATVYGGGMVTFSGNSRVIIRNNVTYSGANTKIKLSGSGTGGFGNGNAFLLLGDNTAFTFTGHDASTAFTADDGKGMLRTGNNTTVTPHVYVDPNVTFYNIGTHRGVSLYKTNVSTHSVTMSYANAARITLDENVTLTITNDISSDLFLGSDINRAAIVADAAGSKVVIKGGAHAANMISGNYQVFLSGSTVNWLELDLGSLTYIPNAEITVNTLNVVSGSYDNSSGKMTILQLLDITTNTNEIIQPTRLMVYANSSNQLVINAPEISNYAVYNTVGQLLTSGMTVSENYIPAITLQSGVYLVKVNNILEKVIVN
jgi:hypothetical protein